LPAREPSQVVPASTVRNVKTLGVLYVGAAASGQSTDAGNVGVNAPRRIRVNKVALPDGAGLENVKVQF
jgi:hypothetical protein